VPPFPRAQFSSPIRFPETAHPGAPNVAVQHQSSDRVDTHHAQPARAHLLPDGAGCTEFTDVPVDDLLPGDAIRVLPGERLPADGELLTGETHADESTLAGEARSVPKGEGDKVTGGTLNGEGSEHVSERAVDAQSTLAQIIAMVQDAGAAVGGQSGRAGDRAPGWAFAYNAAGIALAALGYLNPVLAGAGMALSPVSVVSNALLLKRWKPPTGK